MATAKKPARKKPAPKAGARAPKAKVHNSATQAETITDFEQRLCEEYLVDLNQTQAYLRVSPKAKPDSARTLAARVFSKVRVQEFLQKLKVERSDRTKISADKAVQLAWDTMVADARELSEVRVGCCRFCWGKGFLWQRTAGEFARDKAQHQAKLVLADTAKQRAKIGPFDEQGGAGFDKRRDPNPQCPDCAGEGVARTVFKDTSKLSPGAAALFAGVKETKEGFEVKSHSRDAAQDKVFRHLGLYNDKIQLTMPTVIVKDYTGKKEPPAE